jgi:hypothetical protein
MTSHEYKGFDIRKRSGMNRLRKSVSGYAVCFPDGRLCFSTLKEAKAFIDARLEKLTA